MITAESQAKAQLMLGDMQPELADDHAVQTAISVIAAELERLELAAQDLRDNMFAEQMTDTYGVLSLFETLFGLPVAPAISITDRRSRIESHFRKRRLAEGLDWEDALTKAMGTTVYSYSEDPNVVTIRYAFTAGGLTSAVVQSFVREITPAHVQVLATYTGGFLIGISLIGDPL